MIGLYPIVTQPVYLLESPWFSDINMTINGNATLHITSNGDARSLGQSGFYVQSVKINGEEWTKNVSMSTFEANQRLIILLPRPFFFPANRLTGILSPNNTLSRLKLSDWLLTRLHVRTIANL